VDIPTRPFVAFWIELFSALRLLCAALPAEAAELAEDGSTAESAKSTEEVLSLCGPGDLCVE
jgi:hypothetical protein